MLLLATGLYAQDVYQTRICQLHSQVEMQYHAEVKKQVEELLANPEKCRKLIGLSKYYFPLIERNLRSRQVPLDLKYLAVAASELNPASVNTTGGSGLWTMGYQVSKMYKLKVNTYVDERRDPQKSSAVFAQHFKDMYSIYKSWPLVIAAYGCSPVTLNKCIRMAGNSMYFWDIYPFLPASCRDLYPRFMAAAYLMNFSKEHGLKAINPDLLYDADSVLVNRWLSFKQISSTIDISMADLQELNPVFKKDIIPMNADGYYIKIPKGKAGMFDLLKDSVYKPATTEFAPIIIERDTSSNETPETQTKSKTQKTKVFYVVKKGEGLMEIADWFDCSTDELKSWNKLKGAKLNRGQRLTIWVPKNKTGYYRRINKMSVSAKKKLRKKD